MRDFFRTFVVARNGQETNKKRLRNGFRFLQKDTISKHKQKSTYEKQK